MVGAVAALHNLYRGGDGAAELISWAGLLLLALTALGGGVKLALWGARPVTVSVSDEAKARLPESVLAIVAAAAVVVGALGMWWTFRGGYSNWWQSVTGESQWTLLLGVGQMLVAVGAGAALFTGGRYVTGLAKEALTDSGLLIERDRATGKRRAQEGLWHPGLVAALIAGGLGLVLLTAGITPRLYVWITGPDVLPAIASIAFVLLWAIGSNLGWWKGLGGLYTWATDASQKAAATAGVVAVLMFSASGLGLGWFTPATVPVARAACPPDCGGPGGSDGPPGGGQMFQPPSQGGPQMPDYQGGINQPPMDQNGSISIYNTQAPSISNNGANGSNGQQSPQQGWDQPAHGTQPPDYQNATPYTQGPGKPNPDFNGGQTNAGSQGGQAKQGGQQSAQQPQQAPQNQPPQQDAGQQPNQSSDQQKIDDLTRQLQEKQQQSGQDRQRIDDMTKQLQQNKQNQKQQQSTKFPSRDKKKDDEGEQKDRDKQSDDNDLSALLLGAASTRRRKQDEQEQGPDTQALGQDASQAAQGLPGDVQTYVQSGQQIGQSSGQAAQGFGSAAQAGASLASSAQSGAVNPQDAITVVQGVSQGVQGTADAINAGSQIVKTAQGEADQVAQAVGDANPQLKPQTEQFTQLNDTVSKGTEGVGQVASGVSQLSGAVNSVSSMGAGGVPTDATQPVQGLTEDQALSQMQDKLSQGLIDPDIDGDGVDDTEVFVKTLWDKAHQNGQLLPQGPATFNSSKGPTTLSWDEINKFADQKTPEHPESVRSLLPLTKPMEGFRPWEYNLRYDMVKEVGNAPYYGNGISLDDVWNELHRCFNCNFPITGAPSTFPKVGDYFPLTATPFNMDFGVYVTQISKNPGEIAIEYATSPQHIDGPGSTINFRFFEVGDTLNLAIKAIVVDGPGSGDVPVGSALLRFGYGAVGQDTWQPYYNNLVQHIRPDLAVPNPPTPPGIALK
ncbi:hypothetical protein CCUG62472_01004 [Mycobacteroides salmoniphilum]|nr:hypothetical protein CCUG62472_01004 [Mycobacteroides salmoniphilum]